MNRLVPPGARVEYLHLAGGRVRTLRAGGTGDGRRPVVLLHGGGVDNAAISWYRAFATLGEDHQVVAFDLPGFGATSGIDPPGAPAAQADLVARALAQLRLDDAVVIGVSMGGDVALNLALRHPRSVGALVLVAPGGLLPAIADPVAHTAVWLAMRLPERLLRPIVRLGNRFVRPMLRALVRDPATLPEEVVAEVRREGRRPGAGLGYLRYNRACVGRRAMRNYLLPVVDRITVPVLFLHGDSDSVVPLAGSRRAAALMPDARLVVVPECGHWVPLEAHDRFTAEVGAFLTTARPR